MGIINNLFGKKKLLGQWPDRDDFSVFLNTVKDQEEGAVIIFFYPYSKNTTASTLGEAVLKATDILIRKNIAIAVDLSKKIIIAHNSALKGTIELADKETLLEAGFESLFYEIRKSARTRLVSIKNDGSIKFVG